MIKLIQFMACWTFGLFILNKFVFTTMYEIVKDNNANAIMCIMLTAVFTVVIGGIVSKKG